MAGKAQRGLWFDTPTQATQETTVALIEIYFSPIPCGIEWATIIDIHHSQDEAIFKGMSVYL